MNELVDINELTVVKMKTDSLIDYARNPRKNDQVLDKMVAAIKEFGFRIPIVAKSDGQVIDGHLRLKAARKLGLKEVPVALADELSEAQIKAFRLLANRSANWAEWDDELLKLELEEIKELDFPLEMTGFADWEIGNALGVAWDSDLDSIEKLESTEESMDTKIIVTCSQHDKSELIEYLNRVLPESGIINIKVK